MHTSHHFRKLIPGKGRNPSAEDFPEAGWATHNDAHCFLLSLRPQELRVRHRALPAKPRTPLKSFSSLCSKQCRSHGELWARINLLAILALMLQDCTLLLTWFHLLSFCPTAPIPFFFFFGSSVMVAFQLQRMYTECRELSITLSALVHLSEFTSRVYSSIPPSS